MDYGQEAEKQIDELVEDIVQRYQEAKLLRIERSGVTIVRVGDNIFVRWPIPRN